MTFFTFPIVPLMADRMLLNTEDTEVKIPLMMEVTVFRIPFQIVEMVVLIVLVMVVITLNIVFQTVVNTD